MLSKEHKTVQSRILLGIVITIILIGCTQRTPVSTVSLSESPHSILPSPTPSPTRTKAPKPTSTLTPQPTWTPTASPSPTPTYPQYNDEPFRVVFVRNGDLWLSEVGGSGELRLTTEPADWPVQEYAISPACDKVAYIVYHSPPGPNAHIKQVDLFTGAVSVLTGESDPYIEYNIGWLDDTHITFSLSEFAASGHTKETPAWEGFEPFHHLVFDLVTGERTFVPESLHFSQSPNGRYWLTGSCYYVYECPLEYVLYDLVTGEQWQVAKDIRWGRFLGWSPDSQWMLFSAYERGETIGSVQLVLIDVTTLEEQQITPSDKDVRAASWSPNSQSIALSQCDAEGCFLWTLSRDGNNLQRVSSEITDAAWSVAWSPDSSRLIFAREEDTSVIWSIRIDGTDLRPIIPDAGLASVLCER
jgi:WD40 repeat protein